MVQFLLYYQEFLRFFWSIDNIEVSNLIYTKEGLSFVLFSVFIIMVKFIENSLLATPISSRKEDNNMDKLFVAAIFNYVHTVGLGILLTKKSLK